MHVTSHNSGVYALLKRIVFITLMLYNNAMAQPPRPNKPIVLHADDTAAFAQPPQGFDTLRTEIAHGKLDSVWYNSKTVGNKRRMFIYTPPSYTSSQKYPVLYLLHGIGGDEKEWNFWSKPNLIMDNLIADKKAVPMIVIFPNGRAMPDDRPGENIFDSLKVKAFANFEFDLINDLIPFINEQYPVLKDNANRAIAGFSMGGGQSLNFGLAHPETFAWVGGFSSAPNTKKPEDLIHDPGSLSKKIKLLYISCGNKDGLISISQGLHSYLITHQFKHIYHIQPGEHNIEPWKKDLYHFAQLIFK